MFVVHLSLPPPSFHPHPNNSPPLSVTQVDQLITRDANISKVDHAQQTPMHAASALGYEEIAEAMLKYKLAQDEKLLNQVGIE